MFINFFLELKAARVPVSLREYLTLVEGMIKSPDREAGGLNVTRQSIVSFWLAERHEQTLLKRFKKPTVWR